MCGICLVLRSDRTPALPPWPFRRPSVAIPQESCVLPPHQDVLDVLTRRGPDSSSSRSVRVQGRASEGSGAVEATLCLTATTLSLRHDHVPPHPLPLHGEACTASCEGDALLLYNGELYDVPCTEANPACSDTQLLSSILHPLLHPDAEGVERDVLDALDSLRGPYAFLLWAPEAKRLYFARDILGRRSLLISAIPGTGIVITSVAPRENFEHFVEVPPMGLCYLDFAAEPAVSEPHVGAEDAGKLSASWPRFGVVRRPSREVVPRGPRHPGSKNVPPRPHGSRRLDDALNVSFLPAAMLRGARDPDSDSSCGALECAADDSVGELILLLERAVARRLVLRRPGELGSGAKPESESSPQFAVLFSGGLDSLVLAVILDRVLPSSDPVDLVNVAFGKDPGDCARCPDRVSGVAGYAELLAVLQSERAVRLICADVLPDEADEARDVHVRHLLHPCEQHMDASIGTAIWVAARAEGYVYSPEVPASSDSSSDGEARQAEARRTLSKVTSSARVLFSGLGVDELMGGYKGRHRTSFKLGGSAAVARDIDADVSRLWCRNLGRDDRLISDSGREVRHPYLDEDVVEFVTRLPLEEHVCNLALPDGVGDKQLLRRAAARLGLPESAVSRPKRAIQFGSRSKHVLERSRA